MMPTRTDKVPNTSATAALGRRSERRRDRGRVRTDPGPAAARRCEVTGVPEAEVRFVDGRLAGVSWDEIVRLAYFDRIQLWAAGYYRTAGLHWDCRP